MRLKIILVLLYISQPSFPWSEEGHKLIADKAVDLLKQKIENLDLYKDYITNHSIDADIRKHHDKTEGPKHYIDIDFYEEYLSGRMIQDENQLISLYGDSIVTKMGLLPWATFDTFNNLTLAFKEMNRDKILICLSDLAHYVADAHQPLHTILNYDGQYTNQEGIHYRYESTMIEKYLNEISDETEGKEIIFVENPLNYIFNYISNSSSLSEVLFASDKSAAERAGSVENDEYYRLLWFKTKYITKIQFESAYNSLASLIYTAWVDAGEPPINDLN